MPNTETALTLLESFRNGALTLREALRERIERIEERNGTLLALREVDVDDALAQAMVLDNRRDEAGSLPLFGVPIVIKDNVAQAGKPNRAGRKDAAGEPAAADAAIVRRLHEAGAIVLARANMDELAYGVTGSNPHTGQVRNARNEALHPGGSSAGSASAVAAGMVPLAIGTDTAGSVRIPASLCGVVGMRPTYGWVPSQGIAPLSSSLDTAGPIARTVRDAALLLSVMTDSALLATAPDDRAGEVRGLSIGVLNGTFAFNVSEGVKVQFEAACDDLKTLVASMARATIPELAGGPRASGPIIGSEASYAWQEELEAHPEWFGEEVAGHLNKGAMLKAVRYLRARDDCATVVGAIDKAFERFDVLALPTTATVATPVSDPGAQLQFLALTVPFSLGGYPAITVPMGNVDGAPTGLQLVGKRGEDAMLLALAAAFEG